MFKDETAVSPKKDDRLMYIPQKLQEYFILQKETFGSNIIVRGQLSCCGSHRFAISYFGKMETGLFCRKTIYPQEDILALNAKCQLCRREIHVFNSITDGYDGYASIDTFSHLYELNELFCPKCTKAEFSISLSFEYQSEEELLEDGVQDYRNAFSWIWISPTCLSCGKTYKNLVDMETA